MGEEKERRRFIIWEISICTALISGIAFLTILGNLHFGDEGWYSYDIYQIVLGKRPYRDFFHHRLPLFIEFFALICKVVGISLLKLRIVAGILSLSVFALTYIFIRKNIGEKLGLIGILMLITGFDALKYFTSIQSYSLVASCLLIAVFIAKAEVGNIIKFPLIGIFMVFTQWCRYPVAYIPIAYILFLVLYNYKDWKVLVLSFLCFFAGHLTLFIIHDSPEFRFDIVYGMFQNGPGIIDRLLGLKSWLLMNVKHYFAIGIILFVILIEHFKKQSIEQTVNKIIENEWLFFSLILIIGNFSMYTLGGSHVMQMIYVLPLIVVLTVYLLKLHLRSFSQPVIKNAFFVFIIIFVILGSHGRGLYSYRLRNSHIKLLRFVKNKEADVIIVNDRMLNPTGMGRVLERVREPLLELVKENYKEINIDDRQFEQVIGTLKLYVRKEQDYSSIVDVSK